MYNKHMKNYISLIYLCFAISSAHAKWVNASFQPMPYTDGGTNYAMDVRTYKGLTVGLEYYKWDILFGDYVYDAKWYALRLFYYLGKEDETNKYKKGAFEQGMYFAFKKYFVDLDITREYYSEDYTATTSSEGNSFGVGYHWQWDYLSMQLGFHVLNTNLPEEIELEGPDNASLDDEIMSEQMGDGLSINWSIGISFI